jgi:hypothetical protein
MEKQVKYAELLKKDAGKQLVESSKNLLHAKAEREFAEQLKLEAKGSGR